jgi:hypothetical protein
VGYATFEGYKHALLWADTAESYIDLHPSVFDESMARGVSGSEQGGYGVTGGLSHALLWSGTAESVVDLHPSGFDESMVRDISDELQAGYGIVGGISHALLWNGTAESVIDLHSYLPAQYVMSEAYGIDSAGNVVGRAYTSAEDPTTGRAILWAIPEPGTLLLLSLGGLMLRRRRG